MNQPIHHRDYFIALLPAAVVVSFEVIAANLANSDIARALAVGCCNAKNQVWSEASHRLDVISSAAMLSALVAVVTVMSIVGMYRTFKGSSGWIMMIAWVCFGLGTWLALAFFTMRDAVFSDVYYLGRDFFAFASFRAFVLSGWATGNIFLILNFEKVLIAIAVISAVAALICCLGRPDTNSAPDQQSKHWIEQAARMKVMLYASSAALVVGVLASRAWAAYPSFILAGEEAQAYSRLINSFTIFGGLQYTFALASVVLPVALLIRKRMDDIPKKTAGDRETRSAAAAEKDYDPWDIVRGFAAILAPLAAGAITGLAPISI